jgi:hypothetical protein
MISELSRPFTGNGEHIKRTIAKRTRNDMRHTWIC